jgi:hypothetical protein
MRKAVTMAENKAACRLCQSDRNQRPSLTYETHENEQHIQIRIPLRQPLFIKLLRNFVISGPNVRVDTARYICGFIMGWTGVGAGEGIVSNR